MQLQKTVAIDKHYTLQDESGQSTVEIITIVIVISGLVLATYGVVTQRNQETGRLFSIQKDNMRCREVSGLITRLNASQDYSETLISGLEKDLHIEKGSIVIQGWGEGSISCRYAGTAWLEENEDSHIQDSEGFDLVKGDTGGSTAYKVKKQEIGVVFCDNAQGWCSGT